MSIRGAISLEGVRVTKLTYVINEDYVDSGQPIGLEVDFSFNIGLNGKDESAKVSLACYVNKSDDQTKPFRLEVIMEGLFSYKSELQGEPLEKMLTTNAIAIIFPYLRSTVSTITVNCGADPIILPTINVVELLKAKGSPSR